MTVHGSDHLRRGLGMDHHEPVPWPGPVQIVLTGATVAIAALAVLVTRSGHRLAPPAAAVIGLGSAAAFLVLHLAPRRGHLVDTFIDPQYGAHVGWYSWLTLSIGLAGCLILGLVGLRALWSGAS
jgi:hypothetical protein